MGFTLYGPYHISWLVISLLSVLLTSKFFLGLNDKGKRILQLSLGWFLLFFELYKDIYLMFRGEFNIGYLPLDLCGMAIFAILYHAYTNNPFVGEMLYNLFLPGAIAALLFSNWTHRSMFEFMSFFSFIFHIVIVVYCIMVLRSGIIRPHVKRIWSSVLFLAIVAPIIYPLNKLWDTNYLFLNVPSPGSPLVPLEKIFGNPGYLFGLALLIAIIWIIMYLPWYHKSKNA